MLGMSFVHDVVTRWNIPMDEQDTVCRFLDEDWLTARLGLFKSITLPSMEAQAGEFRWVLLVHENTPRRIVEELRNPRIEILFVNSLWISQVRDCSAARVRDAGASHLIMTRLDSDDALEKSYIKTVQANFSEQAMEVIDFPNGYLYHNGELLHRVKVYNQFLSLVSRVDAEGRSPFLRGHRRQAILSSQPDSTYRRVDTAPAWLLVDHDDNARVKKVRSAPDEPYRKVDRAEEVLRSAFGITAL
jgi:hypothetical protein